jgi:hypothetical protein
MRVMVDKRVEQTLRHLSQREAARIFVFMEQLQEQSLEAFRARRDVELRGKGGRPGMIGLRLCRKGSSSSIETHSPLSDADCPTISEVCRVCIVVGPRADAKGYRED